MTAEAVLAVLVRLMNARVKVWLDGGWGIDALLGEQTRDHDDLDLVVELDAVAGVLDVLSDLGYEITEDERPVRAVLATPDGCSIDLHTVTFDENDGGVQMQPNGGAYRYPPEGFKARGTVSGVELPCLTPQVQVECHMGYEPTATDRRDISLLCERFGLPLPEAYQ